VTDLLAVAIDMMSTSMTGGVRGVVTVSYMDSTRAAGAAVTLVVTHVGPLGDIRSTTIEGEADENGQFSFELPTSFTLVGNYRAVATAASTGNSGTTAAHYAVGL